ncbi:MAG: hypothetical protein FVQ85_04360 [Planctomycetes bacterium]|nr:hypothetical protein [Planctomycetota bacterium]
MIELVAAELGIPEGNLQINIENTQADPEDIQPCQSYAGLVNSATVLSDPGGTGLAALAKVVSEFISPDMPMSEEQLASLSQALALRRNTDDKPHYAPAGQWLDALAEYFGILTTDIGWSVDDSVLFVADKYFVSATEGDDMNLLAFLHLQLQVLSGS